MGLSNPLVAHSQVIFLNIIVNKKLQIKKAARKRAASGSSFTSSLFYLYLQTLIDRSAFYFAQYFALNPLQLRFVKTENGIQPVCLPTHVQ